MRLFFASVFLLLITHSSLAKWVIGTVVTNDSVVLEGKIYLNDRWVTSERAFIRNGLVFNEYYREIHFKHKDEKSKLYGPNDILEYNFNYKGKSYFFKSFALHYTSIVKAERERESFLQLMFSGEVRLYRHLSESLYNDGVIKDEPTIDYYFYNREKGLTRIERGGDYEHLQDILLAYNFDKHFVDELYKRINIRDIPQIIADYESWLRANNLPQVFNI